MRPNTLAETYERLARGAPRETTFAEFLDAFYADPSRSGRLARLALEPPRLVDDPKFDALAAAASAYLSRLYRLPEIPAWCADPSRILASPWFTTDSPSAGLREYLTWSSPAEFRVRNIFTEARPLRRAMSHVQPTEP